MGRPTKYTPETAKKILEAIRVGTTFRLACAYGGITEETFSQWRKKYPEFSESVKEAVGTAAVSWLAKIEKAASDGTWQAAAWKLERLYPREYGRQVIEHDHRMIPWDKVPEDVLDGFLSKKLTVDDVLASISNN